MSTRHHFRLASFGAGGHADDHLRADETRPDRVVAAVCDVNEPLARRFAAEAVNTDAQTMLAEAAIDAVAVCTTARAAGGVPRGCDRRRRALLDPSTAIGDGLVHPRAAGHAAQAEWHIVEVDTTAPDMSNVMVASYRHLTEKGLSHESS